MISYQETYGTFKNHIENNVIVSKILKDLGQDVSQSEKRSWHNSLGEMYKVLNASGIPDNIHVGIEYKLPISLKRIDLLLSGNDGNQDYLVIIELKQWDRIEKTEMPDVVKMGGRYYTHPSWQAYSYMQVLRYFNEAVERESIAMQPCAFLHNYSEDNKEELTSNIYSEAIDYAPLFMQSDYEKLSRFISHYIKGPSQKNLLYEIDQGKIRPSKMLVEALGSMLNNNEEYTLVDEQKVVNEYLYKIPLKKRKHDRKQVIIVEGGAGTGKSLIAIKLISKFIQKGMTAFYVAKSSYVRENYFKKLTKDVPNFKFLKTLFKGSGSFIDSLENDFDCLVVDEAHRLTEKTKQSWFYKGEDQVREIIHAAKTSIFFIDPKQQIDIKDHGSIETIKYWADFYEAEIHHDDNLKLKSQFRCNGSDVYMQWVDSLLYDEPFDGYGEDINYDIRLFDDVHVMKEALRKKNGNNKARMIAGDVFPWISREDKNAIDIHMDNLHAQWNRTKSFATDKEAFDQVGCIHTTQGMEFEYIGLIISDDLLYRNGKIITDYTRHPEKANEFKRPYKRKIRDEDSQIIDRLIRNTYRVLMSRGQKGCFIYCMDEPLKEYIKHRLEEIGK